MQGQCTGPSVCASAIGLGLNQLHPLNEHQRAIGHQRSVDLARSLLLGELRRVFA